MRQALPRQGVANRSTRMARPESVAGLSAVLAILLGASAAAQDEAAPPPARPETATSICLMAEAAARANGLPFEFFARLIWQESRFRSDAVGPMTRSGDRARG